MKKILLILALLAVYGCGSNQSEQAKQVPSEDPQKKEDLYISEGISYLQQGNAAEAIKSFDESIKQYPTDPRRYMVLAHTYMRLKNYSRAIDTYTAALRYAENKGEVYYLLAVCYGLTGNQSMTQESIQKSIEMFTQDRDEVNLAKALAFIQNFNTNQAVAE
ncbi:MAG: tetratricopeptide repeat protein [Candidatus Omnitrophica bacterium]|nr:tetratricopeptide repeat protein [Candidatus Omnitrophota bacterium]